MLKPTVKKTSKTGRKAIYKIIETFTYKNFLVKYPKLNLGSLVLSFFCVFLIIMSTFTQVELAIIHFPKTAYASIDSFLNALGNISQYSKPVSYIPQIPVVLFIGALLGPWLGLLAVFIYLILGLAGFPVFASGGGFDYYTRPAFGYIIGYFAGVFAVALGMKGDIKVTSIIKSAFAGALSVHIIGIIYLIGFLMLTGASMPVMLQWIDTLTFRQFAFDFGFSLIALSLARPLRGVFWVFADRNLF